jgi:hypothetical protein
MSRRERSRETKTRGFRVCQGEGIGLWGIRRREPCKVAGGERIFRVRLSIFGFRLPRLWARQSYFL